MTGLITTLVLHKWYSLKPRKITSHSFWHCSDSTVVDSHIKLLGVTLDSHLPMSKHTKLVPQSCFYHIWALCHIRHGMLDLPTATAIALAVISNQLDYASSNLYGSPSKKITHLQRAENAATRVVTQKPSHLSSADTLHELHWLQVQWHIKFKLASLTFKVLHLTPHISYSLQSFVFSGHLPSLTSALH